ncbi:hypothetical protein GGI12_005396 [Dipsacomyces acuminosporus]|nr:hypothetical protein GGI12_005396 [Dipsacomyces acuminosporus]
MVEAEPNQIVFIGIHERTPELRVLYMSSSVRHALLYEPREFMNRSALEFILNVEEGEEAKTHFGAATDDNVMMAYAFVKNKNGVPVYIRSIAFACGNVGFQLATAYPDVDFEQQRQRLTVQRFRCNLGESATEHDRQVLESILSSQQNQFSTGSSNSTTARGRGSLGASAIYSARTTCQACFVVNNVYASSRHRVSELKVLFVTDSINTILDVDASDLQNKQFLSLVADQDLAKATSFLERMLQNNGLVLERLELLADPQQGHRSVAAEFIGMGSDDGAIMLCQLERSSIAQLDGRGRYISLEDIISSDPETSDCPDAWKRISL